MHGKDPHSLCGHPRRCSVLLRALLLLLLGRLVGRTSSPKLLEPAYPEWRGSSNSLARERSASFVNVP